MTNKLALSSALALTVTTLAALAASGSARANVPVGDPSNVQLRDLCDSTRAVCEYTGPNAPVLDAAVCLDGMGTVRLQTTGGCPLGSVAFHARYGEVYDPGQNLVVAYIPLANACSQAGLCETAEITPGASAMPICCWGAICWPGSDCDGTLFWCHDGVCNEDGTVTCFDGQEVFD
ncbi:hypothetical protein PPSIR1_39740 [Plesiocystis pacifica SIR-1]|uniref:Uncharacterized protein n=1 Tax=Plesiocystis pacifica SIR-1 TaxID=391625 RepID=A6FY78_9BACT|nr:hypothetical protein [Plesiocystis pacifica]EDM81457.1 hypothetical protein PPSIR1_39740 [Plesiocystis pacifica SIR-1]